MSEQTSEQYFISLMQISTPFVLAMFQEAATNGRGSVSDTFEDLRSAAENGSEYMIAFNYGKAITAERTAYLFILLNLDDNWPKMGLLTEALIASTVPQTNV